MITKFHKLGKLESHFWRGRSRRQIVQPMIASAATSIPIGDIGNAASSGWPSPVLGRVVTMPSDGSSESESEFAPASPPTPEDRGGLAMSGGGAETTGVAAGMEPA